MKQSCVAGATLTCILAGSAMAADMPVKAPVYPTSFSWTGFYIGVHGGYGWARPSISDFDLNGPHLSFSETSFDAPKLRGAVFGGHAGYNWQWGQRGVAGLEIDYSAADIKQTQEGGVASTRITGGIATITRTFTAKLDSLASARARVGFLLGPEFLLYGTGGTAWGHTKFSNARVGLFRDIQEDIDVARASANPVGWVAGAGAEWKLWEGIILRVEYLHYDFGSASLPFDTTFSHLNSASKKGESLNLPLEGLTTNVVRGGVSYKF